MATVLPYKQVVQFEHDGQLPIDIDKNVDGYSNRTTSVQRASGVFRDL